MGWLPTPVIYFTFVFSASFTTKIINQSSPITIRIWSVCIVVSPLVGVFRPPSYLLLEVKYHFLDIPFAIFVDIDISKALLVGGLSVYIYHSYFSLIATPVGRGVAS